MATSPDKVDMDPKSNSGDLIKEQEDLLQCPICIDRLENPKDLLCNHTFCKSCLDDLLEFQNDGSAIIQCPMKCTPVNYIDKTMTTNDLKTSYHLKSMLDWFDTKESKETNVTTELPCQGEEKCTNVITTYCTTCSLMMCQSCQLKHTLTQNSQTSTTRSYIPIKYDKKYDGTVPMCKNHDTVAKLICCEKEFICIYCRQRRHKGHLCEHIEVIANQIQTEIITMEKNVKSRTEQIQKGVGNALQATETAINEGRILLKNAIERQKIACMSQYYNFLKSEEERLLGEYNEVTASHIELYKWNHSRDNFLNLKEKLPFQFIHEEEKLFEHMLERSFGVEVPLLTISKRDATYDSCNPLGNITLNVTDNVVINHESVDVSSITVNISENEQPGERSRSFLHDLQQLVVQGIGNEEKERELKQQQYEPFDRGIVNEPNYTLLNRMGVERNMPQPEITNLSSSEEILQPTESIDLTTNISHVESDTGDESETHNFTRSSVQLISVELIKNSYQDFGLYLSGDDGSNRGVVVCDVDKGSPAHKKLKIGDKIITINGVILNGDVEHDILQQINTAGNKILLGIRRSCTNFVSYN